jgi:hypothetical protein
MNNQTRYNFGKNLLIKNLTQDTYGGLQICFQFFMNNKLVTEVLCFGSHICKQAARIRVK